MGKVAGASVFALGLLGCSSSPTSPSPPPAPPLVTETFEGAFTEGHTVYHPFSVGQEGPVTIGVIEFRSLYLDTDWVTLRVCHWVPDGGNGGLCEDLPPNDRYGNSTAGILVDQYALATGYGFASPFYAPPGEYRLAVFHHLYEWSGPEYSYVVSVEHPR